METSQYRGSKEEGKFKDQSIFNRDALEWLCKSFCLAGRTMMVDEELVCRLKLEDFGQCMHPLKVSKVLDKRGLTMWNLLGFDTKAGIATDRPLIVRTTIGRASKRGTNDNKGHKSRSYQSTAIGEQYRKSSTTAMQGRRAIIQGRFFSLRTNRDYLAHHGKRSLRLWCCGLNFNIYVGESIERLEAIATMRTGGLVSTAPISIAREGEGTERPKATAPRRFGDPVSTADRSDSNIAEIAAT
uniref:Uncharacterized protein n=1 Tax=Oryza rufipogon TaxID=4529 RepID=A0A0E0P8G9_ORYRU